MSYKPTYSVYRYNLNGDFVPCNKFIHGSAKRFPTVWEALNGVRKLAQKIWDSTGGRTELDLNPNTQYIIVEYFNPGESRIKCIVSQEGIMQEKFNYKTEEFSG